MITKTSHVASFDENHDEDDGDDDGDDDDAGDGDDDELRMMNIWLLMIDDAFIDAKYDNFAKRDGRSDGATDTAAYWDAMDASKK